MGTSKVWGHEASSLRSVLSLRTGDRIVMVNGVSVENVTSAFAIQILKTCTKLANIVSGGGGRGSPSITGSLDPQPHPVPGPVTLGVEVSTVGT